MHVSIVNEMLPNKGEVMLPYLNSLISCDTINFK